MSNDNCTNNLVNNLIKNHHMAIDKLSLKNNHDIVNINHQKAKNFWWLKITSIFNLTLFITLLVLVSVTSTKQLYQVLHINPSATDNGLFGNAIVKVYLLLIITLVVINSILFMIVSFNNKWVALMKDYRFISIMLTIFSFNFYGLVFIINEIIKANKTNLNKTKWWVTFKKQLGIKKWVTFDYVLIALICGVTISFTYIEENLLPKMPNGGTAGLKYIPLIMISFTTCFLGGWLTGAISALMALLFIPGNLILSPWSYLFDYFLPMTTPAFVALLPFKVTNDKSIFTYINYFLHCFIISSLIYLWLVLSGILFWGTMGVWPGYSLLIYSLVYNFIPVFIFTYPLLQIIIPILYRSLGYYYLRKFH